MYFLNRLINNIFAWHIWGRRNYMENTQNLSVEIEKILKCIPGVLFTKVVIQENTEEFNVEEINIVATTERNAKQISKDIQSIMSAKFDLSLDHKKVSIAQIQHETSTNLSKKSDRLQIEGIDYGIKGNQVRTEVTLKYDDKIYTSEETGPNTLSNTNLSYVTKTRYFISTIPKTVIINASI